jgi:hypothetical protein
MIKKTLLFCILILALVFASTTAIAETIYLKDGTIVRGTIAQENDAFIMVEIGDSWQKIDKSTIELVTKDEVKPVPAAVDKPAAQPIASEASRRKGSGVYLGFQVPYNMIGGDFDGTTMPEVDSGIGFGLILGYSFTPQFGMEIDWAGSGHNSEGADIGFGELSLNMKFSFLPEGAARPFLFAGIGAFTLGDSSLTFGGTGYNLGIGIDFPVADTNTIGLALIRKIITYDEIVKSDAPLTLVGDLKGDTTSIRFDFTHHF